MNTVTTKDGTTMFYKDWGKGPTVVFSHGWPLNADAWHAQMLFLGQNGCRVIAHDRRGHGRSSQPWDGNNMDTYADDLGALLDRQDLKNVTLVSGPGCIGRSRAQTPSSPCAALNSADARRISGNGAHGGSNRPHDFISQIWRAPFHYW
jgi:hypothetical protein